VRLARRRPLFTFLKSHVHQIKKGGNSHYLLCSASLLRGLHRDIPRRLVWCYLFADHNPLKKTPDIGCFFVFSSTQAWSRAEHRYFAIQNIEGRPRCALFREGSAQWGAHDRMRRRIASIKALLSLFPHRHGKGLSETPEREDHKWKQRFRFSSPMR